MSKRKRRTSEQIEKDILAYLNRETFPRTTGQIAESVGIIWYKANELLRKMKIEELVYHEKVGRQNQWCLMEKYKHGFVR